MFIIFEYVYDNRIFGFKYGIVYYIIIKIMKLICKIFNLNMVKIIGFYSFLKDYIYNVNF